MTLEAPCSSENFVVDRRWRYKFPDSFHSSSCDILFQTGPPFVAKTPAVNSPGILIQENFTKSFSTSSALYDIGSTLVIGELCCRQAMWI